jgi:spore coat protein U-like protein
MTNSDSMDCDLYSDSGFSTLVGSSQNGCTAGTNLSATFAGSGSGLTGSTTYYLRIEGQSSTAKASTYNITVACPGC